MTDRLCELAAMKRFGPSRFEMLLEMPGHHGEVWACAVSSRGDMVVTGMCLKAPCVFDMSVCADLAWGCPVPVRCRQKLQEGRVTMMPGLLAT
jgi:hypothetical protein